MNNDKTFLCLFQAFLREHCCSIAENYMFFLIGRSQKSIKKIKQRCPDNSHIDKKLYYYQFLSNFRVPSGHT